MSDYIRLALLALLVFVVAAATPPCPKDQPECFSGVLSEGQDAKWRVMLKPVRCQP